MKKYQAATVLSTATNIPGRRPAMKVVRMTAGKNVRKGKPAGRIACNSHRLASANAKAASPRP
jgi:hypothetical protein